MQRIIFLDVPVFWLQQSQALRIVNPKPTGGETIKFLSITHALHVIPNIHLIPSLNGQQQWENSLFGAGFTEAHQMMQSGRFEVHVDTKHASAPGRQYSCGGSQRGCPPHAAAEAIEGNDYWRGDVFV